MLLLVALRKPMMLADSQASGRRRLRLRCFAMAKVCRLGHMEGPWGTIFSPAQAPCGSVGRKMAVTHPWSQSERRGAAAPYDSVLMRTLYRR